MYKTRDAPVWFSKANIFQTISITNKQMQKRLDTPLIYTCAQELSLTICWEWYCRNSLRSFHRCFLIFHHVNRLLPPTYEFKLTEATVLCEDSSYKSQLSNLCGWEFDKRIFSVYLNTCIICTLKELLITITIHPAHTALKQSPFYY